MISPVDAALKKYLSDGNRDLNLSSQREEIANGGAEILILEFSLVMLQWTQGAQTTHVS